MVVSRKCVLKTSDHTFESILGGSVDRFLMFFVKRGASIGDAKNIVLYCCLQYLVAIDLLTKKAKTKKHVVSMEGVLRDGCRHHLFIDVGSILYRCSIDTVIVATTSINYRYCIDTVSMPHRYRIDTVSILYRYCTDTVAV